MTCGCSEGMMFGGGSSKSKKKETLNDTKTYWYAKAKALDIAGRSKMTKDELKCAVKRKSKK